MKKKILKVLSIILTSSVLFTSVDISAFAQDYNEPVEVSMTDEDVSEKKGYVLSNPIVKSDEDVTWDCIWFGNYWQNDTNSDGIADKSDDKEPIKWRLLNVSNGDAFIVADKALDCMRYYPEYANMTWKKSTIRSWLNGYASNENLYGTDYSNDNFMDNAFDKFDQDAIKISDIDNGDSSFTDLGEITSDRVYLLSVDEATNNDYGFNPYGNVVDPARFLYCTEYALDADAALGTWKIEYANNALWWLRSIHSSLYNAGMVNCNGVISNYNIYWHEGAVNGVRKYLCVRPAMHIDLNKANWSYAGTVSTKDGVKEIKPYEEEEFGTYFTTEDRVDKLSYIYDMNNEHIESKIDIVGDDANFIKVSNNYNHQMARYAASIATMTYMSDTLEGRNIIVENFEKLGFSDVSSASSIIKNNEYYNFYPDPTCNISITGDGLYSPCWIVHKKVRIDGKLTTIMIVSVRGTYHEEWIDNFKTEDQDTHIGFERAANYIYDELVEYINRNNLDSEEIHILITGHSRGAVVSNLLGAKINDNKDNKSYFRKENTHVYTFASPNPSKKAQANGYENIFNIVNPEDFVTKVMLSKWDYRRYGSNCVLPSATTEDSNYYDQYRVALSEKFERYANYCDITQAYPNGMERVSKYISNMGKEVTSSRDYNYKLLNNKFWYSTARDLYIRFLGYNRCENKDKYKISMSMISDMLIGQYGNVGRETFTFFAWNGSITSYFANAHQAETYLAAMYTIEENDLLRTKKTLYGIVNCPVDITVKNSSGEVVGSIVNNVVDESIENSITMSVDGDSKSFYIPSGDTFSLELTGNDDGVMDYSLCLVDADTGEISRDYYHNIPVVKGESYKQTFNLETDLKSDLTDKDSKTVSVNAIFDDTNRETLTYNVTVEGEGQANSIYNVTPGDYVTLSAYVDENNEFYGWYDNDDNLISTDLEYSFSAYESADYIAKFSNVIVPTSSLDAAKDVVYMLVGDYSVNNVTVAPENATYKFPVYESSDESIAEVDMFGGITAKSEGSATVTVKSIDGVETSYKVYVTKAEYTLTLDANGGLFETNEDGISVAPNKMTASKTVSVNACYGTLPTPVKDSYSFIGWFTDKEAGVQIDADYIVETDKDITLYAHWEYENIKPEPTPTPTPTPTPVPDTPDVPKPTPIPDVPTVDPHADDNKVIVKQKIDVSGMFDLSSLGKEEKLAGYIVSEGKKNASITKKGLLSPKKPGDITIEAYKVVKEGKKKVKKTVSSIKLVVVKPEFDKAAMVGRKPGQIIDITKLIKIPMNQKVEWSASKSSAATMDDKGMVTIGNKSGKLTVTATLTNKDGKKVKIKGKLVIKLPKLSKAKLIIKEGKTAKLSVRNIVDDASQKITWSTSDATVAIYDESAGTVVAKGKGNAVINAEIEGVAYTCNVTVK